MITIGLILKTIFSVVLAFGFISLMKIIFKKNEEKLMKSLPYIIALITICAVISIIFFANYALIILQILYKNWL